MRYEDLLSNIEVQIKSLCEYLQIDIADSLIPSIASLCTFNSMKRLSPRHLRSGQVGQWEWQLTLAQKNKFSQDLQGILEILGYE